MGCLFFWRKVNAPFLMMSVSDGDFNQLWLCCRCSYQGMNRWAVASAMNLSTWKRTRVISCHFTGLRGGKALWRWGLCVICHLSVLSHILLAHRMKAVQIHCVDKWLTQKHVDAVNQFLLRASGMPVILTGLFQFFVLTPDPQERCWWTNRRLTTGIFLSSLRNLYVGK